MKIDDLIVKETGHKVEITHDGHTVTFTAAIVESCVEEFGETWAAKQIKEIIINDRIKLKGPPLAY